MTAPEPVRRVSRLGLYAPLASLALFAILVSVGWLAFRAATLKALAADAARLRGEGWRIAWGDERIHGYPFRLDLDFDRFAARTPERWIVSAPALRAEAFVFSPRHWIVVAPQGLAIGRAGAPAAAEAAIVRLSLDHLDQTPPSLALDARTIAFGPAFAAGPIALASAASLGLHTRAAAPDQGALFLELDGARGQAPGLLGRIVARGPFVLQTEVAWTRADAFAGPDWNDAAHAWADAGGVLRLVAARLEAPGSVVSASSSALSPGPDGRLRGAVALSLTPPGAPIIATSPIIRLDFAGGRTRLGPTAIGPAPRLY